MLGFPFPYKYAITNHLRVHICDIGNTASPIDRPTHITVIDVTGFVVKKYTVFLTFSGFVSMHVLLPIALHVVTTW